MPHQRLLLWLARSAARIRRSGGHGVTGVLTKTPWAVGVLIALALLGPTQATSADRIHKCVVQGRVVYQRDICPDSGPRVQPSVAELNAVRRRERSPDPAASAAPLEASASGPRAPAEVAAPPAQARKLPLKSAAMVPLSSGFRCDGRTYCSQMHSCNEARYFLAHCPGVKMDGNRDGVPCEKQWCN